MGTKNTATQYAQARAGRLSYEEAATFARQLGLTSSTQYFQWYRTNKAKADAAGMYSQPSIVYKAQGTWVSWADFLGCPTIRSRRRLGSKTLKSYEDAKAFVQSLSTTFVNAEHYYEWSAENRIKNGLPNRPDQYYQGKGWMGWTDYLGNADLAFLTWEQFKVAIAELKKVHQIGTLAQYKAWLQENDDPRFPAAPNSYYEQWDKEILKNATGTPDTTV
jgi:hypothetical protein